MTITKYATYVVYKCSHCNTTVEIPLHLKDTPQLEKYASFCTHDWEEIGEEDGKIHTEEDRSIQPSEAGA